MAASSSSVSSKPKRERDSPSKKALLGTEVRILSLRKGAFLLSSMGVPGAIFYRGGYLVKDGEWATEIMSPRIKPFIRGRTPLVVERVRLEGKELEAPWRRPEKETIMVGDRYEGGGRETFQPAGAGTIYIQTITPEKGSWSG